MGKSLGTPDIRCQNHYFQNQSACFQVIDAKGKNNYNRWNIFLKLADILNQLFQHYRRVLNGVEAIWFFDHLTSTVHKPGLRKETEKL